MLILVGIEIATVCASGAALSAAVTREDDVAARSVHTLTQLLHHRDSEEQPSVAERVSQLVTSAVDAVVSPFSVLLAYCPHCV